MDSIRMEHQTQVLDMFSLAIVDGFVAPEELAVIYSKGEELGITRAHVDEILKNPHRVKYHAPVDLVDAIMRLFDLGLVVASDGVIDVREVSLLKSFAKRFGIADALLDTVVENIIDEVKAGTPRRKLVDTLMKEMQS
jgi:hypothetical protein